MKHSKAPLAFVLSLLLFLSPLFIRTVSANWYSYYSQSGYYGLWSTIYTPSNKPYIPSGDHQSNSVTTEGGAAWVQAGWILYPNWNQPKQYMEYFVSGVRHLDYLSDQSWGTGIKYEVSYDGSTGNNRWCVWVNGLKRGCWNDIDPAPRLLIAQSETHITTDTVFWTDFKYIRVRNAAGTWVYPTLVNHMHADHPYGNTVLTSESFRTWRHGIFLPFVVK
jgi:hypothetical protein